jgi:hypothetical protein
MASNRPVQEHIPGAARSPGSRRTARSAAPALWQRQVAALTTLLRFCQWMCGCSRTK